MDKRDQYRFDDRSKEQFVKDISDGNRIERMLLDRWLPTVGNPAVRDTGCGNDGEFLEFDQVSTDPDFFFHSLGTPARLASTPRSRCARSARATSSLFRWTSCFSP